MDYKKYNTEKYNTFAEQFHQRFEEGFTKDIRQFADLFLEKLQGKESPGKKDKKILDLGSGSGTYAKYFQQKGHDVLCVDISKKMVERCQSRGLKARVMDIEHLDLPEKSFDGIWANASLLHVSEQHMPAVVQHIRRILKPGGILAVAVKEGKGESFEQNEFQRFFYYYTDQQIRAFFSDFSIFFFSREKNYYGDVFLDYIFQLK